MAAITAYTPTLDGADSGAAWVTLVASDTLTYLPSASRRQLLVLSNDGASPLTLNLVGSAPPEAVPIDGALPADLSDGVNVIVGAGKMEVIDLHKLRRYFEGTGVVTLTGASGLLAQLVHC